MRRTMTRKERVAFCLYLCMLVLVSLTFGNTSCPDIVSVEMGSNLSISCKSDPTTTDFYWYKGPASDNDLVGKLYHGTKTISAKYRGYFDVTDSGALILLNATLQHESIYTLATFDWDGIPQEASVLVKITVSPNPPCLVISGCNPCEPCYLSVLENPGILVCSVSGSKPSVRLSWTIKSHVGISFFKHQIKEKEDTTKHTRSTSMTLAYEITEPCGVKEILYCEAEDNLQILESNVTSVEISNKPCNDAIPTTDAAPAGFGLGYLLVLIIVLLVIGICFLTGCYIHYRRNRRSRAKRSMVGRQRDVGATRETDLPLLLPNKGKSSKVDRGSLVKALALYYEKFCSLKPLPWGEPIPISALYSDFQCTVTPIQSVEYTSKESQDLEKITSSEDLFALSSFHNASRVIFIADLGYGKTTMTQQVVQQWIREDTKNFILIYIQLKEVDVNTSIASVVKDMLPTSMNATEDNIEKVLKENKVLVLLDGLDELSISVEKDAYEKDEFNDGSRMVKSNNGTSHSESARNNLIIGGLLKEKVRSLNSQIRVWVTSREVDDMKAPFPPPHVKIKMNGFSNRQVDDYIRKTSQYYCHSVKGSNSESTSAMIEDVVNKVRENIDKDDIIQEFVNTPLLLVLIIHILTATFTGTVTHLKDLKLTKLTTLIRTVITCLESRYVQKIQDSQKSSLESKIGEIEMKLGDIAWKQKLEIKDFDRKGWNELLGTEYVNIALSIGLLRLSKQISNSNLQMRQLAFSSFTGVKFYHQYFLEYLAGQYFSTEKQAIKKLEKSLKNISDDKTIRFLQFMSGSGHPSATKVSEIFLKDQKKWNNFVDFIYETEDQDKVESYLEGISRKSRSLGAVPVVNFAYLDKKRHQDAVVAFCKGCNKFNITIRAFTFRQDCPLTYLTQLVLPQLKVLEVLEMTFAEDDFVFILEWLSRQKLPETFQFTKCKFEDKLSPESKQKIKTAMEGKELNIYSNERSSQRGITIDCFDAKKGEWITKWFPKKQ